MPFSIVESLNTTVNAGKKIVSDAKSIYDKAYPKKVNLLSIGEVSSLDRPAPAWRWVASFPPIKSLQLNQIRCENVTLPLNVQLNHTNFFREGIEYHHISGATHEMVSAEFYESEDYTTTGYFKEWLNMIFDPIKKTYGLPGDYKQPIVFDLIPTVATQGQQVPQLFLEECYPFQIDKPTYGAETGRITIKVEFIVAQMNLNIPIAVQNKASKGFTDVASTLNQVLKWKT